MKGLITIISICGMLLVPVGVQAQGTGTAAFDFLNIGVSAKSSAMGGAFSALADGPVSSFYNPAGLSSIDNYQIAGMHTEWYQDLRYEYLGYGMPVGRSGGLGVSFSYLSYGSIAGYTETGVPLGNLEAYDMAFDLSYGHRFGANFSMGLGIKAVSEKLADVRTEGLAGDFGLQMRGDRYTAGLSVMNFGPDLKYGSSSSPLPTTVNAGLMYKPFGTSVALLTGGSMPLHGEFSFKAGIEYSYNDIFMLRSGYDTRQNYEGNAGLSFGAGVNVSNHNLDYAYSINDIMGGTHQISFVFKFGGPRIPGENEEIRTSSDIIQKNEPPAPVVYTVPLYGMTDQVEPEIAENDTSVQESYTEPVKIKPVVIKKTYQVCAARYSVRESAQRHVETLDKFGIDSQLYYDGEREYRVVLGESDKLSKAEKMKSDFESKGVFCFIEEL